MKKCKCCNKLFHVSHCEDNYFCDDCGRVIYKRYINSDNLYDRLFNTHDKILKIQITLYKLFVLLFITMLINLLFSFFSYI
jgi:hypothetical protein